jgi:hypothetical protein
MVVIVRRFISSIFFGFARVEDKWYLSIWWLGNKSQLRVCELCERIWLWLSVCCNYMLCSYVTCTCVDRAPSIDVGFCVVECVYGINRGLNMYLMFGSVYLSNIRNLLNSKGARQPHGS